MYYRNKVLAKRNLISSKEHSFSLNVRSIRSCHKQHRIQTGTIFHTNVICGIPLTFSQMHNTKESITQSNSKKLNQSTHKALAISQCSKRKSTILPLFLDIQHQFTMIIPHFVGYPSSRYSPKKMSK